VDNRKSRFGFSRVQVINDVIKKFNYRCAMTQKTTIDLAQLEQLRHMFQSLPPKQKTEFNTREAVKVLHKDIQKLISLNGYTFAEIAELFNDVGVQVTASTIAAYARELAIGEKKSSKSKAATQKESRSMQPTVEKRSVISASELQKVSTAETHAVAIEVANNLLTLDGISADDARDYVADNNASAAPRTDNVE
jgi:arginine repressor